MSNIKRLRLKEEHPTFGSNKVFDLFQYSPAVVAGNLAFISGQVGMRADGTIPKTAKEQAELAFARMAAILEGLDLDFSSIVELVSYHTDVNSDLADFRAVKEQFIQQDFPAWTIIGVSSLARPDFTIEIKAVACISRKSN